MCRDPLLLFRRPHADKHDVRSGAVQSFDGDVAGPVTRRGTPYVETRVAGTERVCRGFCGAGCPAKEKQGEVLCHGTAAQVDDPIGTRHAHWDIQPRESRAQPDSGAVAVHNVRVFEHGRISRITVCQVHAMDVHVHHGDGMSCVHGLGDGLQQTVKPKAVDADTQETYER
jgi:hypothetical protein